MDFIIRDGGYGGAAISYGVVSGPRRLHSDMVGQPSGADYGMSDGRGLAVVRSNLAQSNRRIILQWVPGHCGLIGNEWADVAAGEAVTTVIPLQDHQQAITYNTAKVLIGRELVDPPTTHERTKAVFDPRPRTPLSMC